MPATRILARLALAAAAAVAAVLGVTFVAQPAHAANDPVTVRLSGLASRQTAGHLDTFNVTLRNETKNDYPNLSRIFAVELSGLSPDGVRMSRNGVTLTPSVSAAGQIVLTDPEPTQLAPKGTRGSSGIWQYQIEFTSTAPSGKAVLGFAAYAGGQQLGTTIVNFSVQNKGGGQGTPTTRPSPTATQPSGAPTKTAGSTNTAGQPANQGAGPSLAALPPDKSSGSSGSGVPILFYVFGVALLGAGGTILWLLVRRPASDLDEAYPVGTGFPFGGDYPSGGYPTSGHPASDGYPTSLGYPTGSGYPEADSQATGGFQPIQKPPRHASPATQLGYPSATLNPTALLPHVGGPHGGLRAPADPWAGLPGADPTEHIDRTDPADLTRDFGAGPISPTP